MQDQTKTCQRCFSFVDHGLSALPVTSVRTQLQTFWQVLQSLGSNPRVISILQEECQLPFKMRPPLMRSPLIIIRYASPLKNSFLKEVLHSLIEIGSKSVVWSSLVFCNRLCLVPKLNNKWRPSLDLSTLNLCLKTETFKMESPETIRFFLQQEEWVTPLDFSDAYFHIPINKE